MTYLARQHHHHQYQKQEQQNESPLSSPQTPQPNINSKHINKRSVTLPTVIKKKREIGDYILCRTIGRGASGKFSIQKRRVSLFCTFYFTYFDNKKSSQKSSKKFCW